MSGPWSSKGAFPGEPSSPVTKRELKKMASSGLEKHQFSDLVEGYSLGLLVTLSSQLSSTMTSISEKERHWDDFKGSYRWMSVGFVH